MMPYCLSLMYKIKILPNSTQLTALGIKKHLSPFITKCKIVNDRKGIMINPVSYCFKFGKPKLLQ